MRHTVAVTGRFASASRWRIAPCTAIAVSTGTLTGIVSVVIAPDRRPPWLMDTLLPRIGRALDQEKSLEPTVAMRLARRQDEHDQPHSLRPLLHALGQQTHCRFEPRLGSLGFTLESQVGQKRKEPGQNNSAKTRRVLLEPIDCRVNDLLNGFGDRHSLLSI
jgi:hypothetical protein